nr:MAG TPA: hypothetical protein [Caudoviricetes sp.]
MGLCECFSFNYHYYITKISYSQEKTQLFLVIFCLTFCGGCCILYI